MRFVIQRVTEAAVRVDGELLGQIEKGYLVLIGVAESDTEEIADKMVKKMTGLRIFEDTPHIFHYPSEFPSAHHSGPQSSEGFPVHSLYVSFSLFWCYSCFEPSHANMRHLPGILHQYMLFENPLMHL